MPPDGEGVAEAKEWLAKAALDLQAATVLLEADPPLAAAAVFHCQQAAEKALKAFLVWHDSPFTKTHDLEEIGSACVERDSTLEALADRAAGLTPFAWRFRYPGGEGAPPAEDARAALALAREVYEAIVNRLPQEARA